MEKEICKCGCDMEVNTPGNFYIHGHNRRGLVSYTANGRWSMEYGRCAECGTTKRKHVGNGLCTKCHRAWRYQLKKEGKFDRWSRNYGCCTDCGRIDRPHLAKGLCVTCYSNKLNRKKGIKKRSFGAWSWYYDKCQKCGTTDRPHGKSGLCRDCYEESKRDFSNGHKKCHVCGVKTVSLNQHLSMKAKKCEKHRKYQYDLFKPYFDSELGLGVIAKELNTERHIVSKNFIKYFGKEETKLRNQKVKSYLCSSRAKIGFNNKNRFGTVVYYDSLANGTVRFRSKLEMKFAIKLDKLGVKWLYEYRSFPYLDKEGKRRTYTPDFYLPDSDKYIEVKGYERKRDQYKIDKLRESGINIEMIKEI